MPLVTSGVDHGNLRELALRRMEELDLQCRDGIFLSMIIIMIIFMTIPLTLFTFLIEFTYL